jgi:hypothetical protein
MIQEIGGSQTGTAVMSIMSIMSIMSGLANGHMPTAQLNQLMAHGLINKSMVCKDPFHHKLEVLPGAVVGNDLLHSDPQAWVEPTEAPMRTITANIVPTPVGVNRVRR